MKLALTNEADAINALCREFGSTLDDLIMFSCNPALLILRVLHEFEIHPKLTIMKHFDFSSIKMWPTIEYHLKR